MDLNALNRAIRSGVKEHSPVILSGLAAVGTLSTAYLSARAGYLSALIIKEEESRVGTASDRKQRLKERFVLVWKVYIPPALATVSTIGFLGAASRIGMKKTFAAQTALTVAQQSFSDYRTKVIEEYGEKKDKAIQDKVNEDRIKNNTPPPDFIVSGTGSVLCCEMYTGRYFMCDMEKLKKSQNEINARMLGHDYATFDDFYYMVGLPSTSTSGQMGWKSPKLVELKFTTILTDDGRPCLAFEYNYVETL